MVSQPQRARSTESRRWAVIVATSLACAVLIADWGRIPTEPVHDGEVAAHTVKAPFDFAYHDAAAYQAARSAAGATTPPVYAHDDGITGELGSQVAAAFRKGRLALGVVDVALPHGKKAPAEPAEPDVEAAIEAAGDGLGGAAPEAALRALAEAGFPVAAEVAIVEWLEQSYDERLVVADRSLLPANGPILVEAADGKGEPEPLADVARIVEPDAVRRAITIEALRSRSPSPWRSAAETVARSLVRPNLVLDAERTGASRADAEAAIAPEPIVVQRGETLFREGDRLTPTKVAMYRALQSSRTDHGVVLQVASLAGFLLLLVGSLYVGARRRFDHEYGTRDLVGFGGLLVLTTLLTRIVTSSAPGIAELVGHDALPESVWYLVPVAGGAMLARALMGVPVSAMFVLSSSTICALLMGFDALHAVYFVLTGLAAASSIELVRERIAVLKAGLLTGAFGAAVVLLLHFVQLHAGDRELSLATTVRPLWSMGFALLGGVLSGFLVLALMPVFESVGFVTDHRMLELASLNHPLLRQLMLRAPGTYHHSVVVGTLAEAACEAIGANSLQAKISAYFHDIGKALQPRYFVENQRGGVNPHHGLTPEQSTELIVRHVTEGARLAREHRLPKPILDNILMHHGTGLLQYFFAKAQMDADDPSTVDEAAFRYPGPKPNCREAGVVMLADKVEAATRTIRHPNEENIRAMINRIINSVIADHQFTECPLTFQEIHTIADTFVTVLLGIHHQRIEYPQTRALSSAGDTRARGAAPRPVAAVGERGQGHVGTITLELEARALTGDGEPLWSEKQVDLTDENTDYESVRNLPHGDF